MPALTEVLGARECIGTGASSSRGERVEFAGVDHPDVAQIGDVIPDRADRGGVLGRLDDDPDRLGVAEDPGDLVGC